MSKSASATRLKPLLRTVGPALVVSALVLAAFLARLRFLRTSPFPTGVDGYFYLLQIRSLLQEGHLYAASAPLVPWLMSGLSLLVEPVLAMKIVAAAGSAALMVPTFFVARRIAKATGPALLGAALVATSAQSIFLSTEFVKQAVGLTLAMSFVAVLAWFAERANARRGAIVAVVLLSCALAHKTAVALALLWSAPLWVSGCWRSRYRWGVGALGLLVLLGGATQNLAVLAQLFSGRMDFSFAVLRAQDRPPLTLGYEVALTAGVAVLAMAVAVVGRSQSGFPWLAMGFCAFAVFQALPWINVTDDQGLGYRLRLAACACLGPCAALLSSRGLGLLGARWRAGIVALAMGLVLLRPWTSSEGVVKAHPAMVEATLNLRGVLPPGTVVVVPERHTAFMAAYNAEVMVRLRPPAGLDPTRTYRLLPGAGIRPGMVMALDLMRAHPRDGVAPALSLHPMHPNGLVLLSEPTFQYLVASLPTVDRQWYQVWPTQ